VSLSAVAFVPYPVAGASARYRVYQFVAPLESLGVRLDVRPFLDDVGFADLYRPGAIAAKIGHHLRGALRRWSDLGVAGRWDVALVHRDLWPFVGDAPLRRMRRCQPRWVYDFDDAVFLPNVSAANRRFRALKPARQYMELVSGARVVAAGNSWLAGWARAQRRTRPEDEVEVVPTVVNTDDWHPLPRGSGPLRLVWTGSHSTVRYLEAWREPLRRVARRIPELEVHVMGAHFEAEGVRVVSHAWGARAERELVASCDVGLSPLPDEPWSRGKCGLKLILYMAHARPAVASPVGVHPEIVCNGVNGILAEGSEAVADALARLLLDERLRRRLGEAARRTAEERYSVRAIAPRLAALLRRAADAPT